MNFSEIIKIVVLETLNSLRPTEVCIGQVVQKTPLKVKLEDNFFITEDEFIRTDKFQGEIEENQKILLIRESGGQRYFALSYIIDDDI